MSVAGGISRKLDIGRVIQETFGVLGRNFVTFLILTLVFVGIPSLLVGFLQLNILHSGKLFAWQTTLGGLIALLTNFILQAAIIFGAVNDLNAQPASLSACFRVGLRTFLPILVIGILLTIAFALGFVLLLVPGLFILCMWCVTIPAYVVEQTSLFKAFGRSQALTAGNRWRILGLLVIYFVALLIIEALMGVFSAPMRIASGGLAGLGFMRLVILTPLLNVANALISTVGVATLYVELRRVREGVGPEGLAALFD